MRKTKLHSTHAFRGFVQWAEVEAAFNRVFSLRERKGGSYQMFAETPSGRRIWVIWRYDREDDEIPDVVGEVPIFVITAY